MVGCVRVSASVKTLVACTTRSTSSGTSKKLFDKILIANRGEIACRVIRTCKRLGIKTVAVYSDADSSGMHVRLADESYYIGGNQSKDSYLRMDKILEVAKKSGAQGIHPGYGFLSENAKFVDMVESAGIAFIGPSSGPMNSMGDKINSKKIAKAANCYVIPGYEGEVENEDAAARLAADVGYPVMIKASAGGGGKGMRVAYNEKEVREGFRLSKAEALSSFGDDRMLIERFIEDPHHIEIQVLADTHGNVVAFPERECSVQRRNQKVVEESPSCLLTPATRKLMQEQAIALCKATGYRSAGTVEMLCDGNQNFYFLEMNTRLQVEHPITELVSGEDLVEHMLRIAAGESLPERLTKNGGCLGSGKGWAIESRVYAEDPLRNFLPSIGPLVTYREPAQFAEPEGTVRIDTGVYEGGVISMYYDPMIAKLCTHAPTRIEAIDIMEEALDNYVVSGLGNNIPFLRAVYRNSVFRSGQYNTKFIGEQWPNGFKGVTLDQKETLKLVASAAALHQMRGKVGAFDDEFDDESHFDAEDVVVVMNGKTYHVSLSMDDFLTRTCSITEEGSTSQMKKVIIDDVSWPLLGPLAYVEFLESSSSHKKESYGRKASSNEEDPVSTTIQFEGRLPEGYRFRMFGSQHDVIVRTPLEHQLSKHMLPPVVKDVSQFLLCPMPGTLISVSVKEGQHVEAGQQLAVVEAMKMQNVLRAEKAGIVSKVFSKAGSNLKVDQAILEFAKN